MSIQLGGKACISVSVNLLKSKCECLLTGVGPDLSFSLMLTTSVLDRGEALLLHANLYQRL